LPQVIQKRTHYARTSILRVKVGTLYNQLCVRQKIKWNTPSPFEELLSQIKKCMTLARDGGDEISDKQAVRSAIANIEATGEFSDACRDWWKKPEDEQTLAIFKTHFKKADTERQR
jgi:hypothetical protein